jgi:FO synthase
MDYVNPEAPWPHIDRLAETCGEEGFDLVPRLPVYDEFLNDEFMAPAMTEAVAARSDTRLEASAS